MSMRKLLHIKVDLCISALSIVATVSFPKQLRILSSTRAVETKI